ncbi:MAG TPA: hypothetical protein DCP92_22305 [Nitrospiraceae bacterium]|jgi:peptidoglycan/xylan/chitin deacetylase (PgdA/CDA1 family)|nr:hypothetical protein [Nitrospiraceae bacterium]
MYHGIDTQAIFNCVAASHFREQLSWLKEHYSIVPLSVLVDAIQFPSPANKMSNLASITFDDCYVNFAELALPILQEYKMHATTFLPTGKVGYYNDWDEGMSGFHKMGIMSYDMLRQLPEQAVEVGSHGIAHVPLDRLSHDEIEKEIVQSRAEIEQNIGRPVRFFAFPFGVYPFKYRLRLREGENDSLGGYRAACTTWWGRYNTIKDIHVLRRVTICDFDTLDDFKDKLYGYYDWLVMKESVGRYYKVMRATF